MASGFMSPSAGVAATLSPAWDSISSVVCCYAVNPVLLCCTCEARGSGSGGARTGSHVHLHIGKFLENFRTLDAARAGKF